MKVFDAILLAIPLPRDGKTMIKPGLNIHIPEYTVLLNQQLSGAGLDWGGGALAK